MNTQSETASPPVIALHAGQSLGQIAISLPGATAVFRRYKLDFCCGGQISLAQAAAEKGLDAKALLEELAGLQRPSTAPEVTDPPVLIDHILARYHEVHRQQFPELIRMARRVEAVHRAHPGVPAGLSDLLESMHAELLSHMLKEEQILFPWLRSGVNPFFAQQPICIMRAEHVAHGATLEKLAAMTDDMTPPADACNTWRALYAGLVQLRDDLMEHIHLENNLLFPQFEQVRGEPACGCH